VPLRDLANRCGRVAIVAVNLGMSSWPCACAGSDCRIGCKPAGAGLDDWLWHGHGLGSQPGCVATFERLKVRGLGPTRRLPAADSATAAGHETRIDPDTG
jgi:hypothetical protein